MTNTTAQTAQTHTGTSDCCTDCGGTAAPRRDLNAEFDANRTRQIASLQDARADLQRRIADYESGAAQAELDAKLAEQVADGKIEMLGNDRYKVLQGWDANEIFSVRKAVRPGELTLIEPESGLDTSAAGEALGWFAVKEWHNQGNVGGAGTMDEVLALSGLDYEVAARPVRYFDDDGNLQMLPDSFVNYRPDTGKGFGVVGKGYRIVQNAEGFEFLQRMVGQHDARFHSAFPLYDGKRAVIAMELPEGIDVDVEGATDHIKLYAAYFNNHDGQGMLQCKITPVRPRCRNTERMALREAVSSWGVRHTRNAMSDANAIKAREQMGLILKYADSFKTEAELLARARASFDDVEKIINEIWAPSETDSKTRKTVESNRRDQFAELWAGYRTELGPNAYAAERTVTDYLDNVAPRRVRSDMLADARATAALVGEDDDKKGKAHRMLMQTVAA